MTQEMIDLQNEAVSKLFECVLREKECTFKAPTGSGKTYMMSDLMNRVLAQDKNVVFVVSTLSKGALGEQNYKAFVNFKNKFTHLKPHLIDTNTSGEEGLDIPLDFNVYVLPRDLYKEGSRLKAGALVNFLDNITGNLWGAKTQNPKKIYLIKDECHIATNNLDELIKSASGGYFERVINFSATPKLARNQCANVEISVQDAVNARLIKDVEWDENETSVESVLAKFKEIKARYLDAQNGVGINPCLIIQISNKDKADNEINAIKRALERHSELKYMIIVDDKNSNKCETNDRLKTARLSVKKWKEHAKSNESSIDIIIFKMVISEGWDIPRACMLYQVRDTHSKQLDEQVMGRVRRNPCLSRFESLNLAQKELISKAYIYGVKPRENSAVAVRLKGQINAGLFSNEIINEFRLKITRLKEGEKLGFNAQAVIENDKNGGENLGIFELVKRLQSHRDLAMECKKFAGNDSAKWVKFASHFSALKKEFNALKEDYENSVEIVESSSESGVLAMSSFFNKSEHNFDKETLEQWFWELENGDKFAFDSTAEKQWVGYMRGLCKQDLVKSIVANGEKIYLFGKNYPYKSSIKFDYYMNGAVHSSYPDFVLKDAQDRIHIFEIKSVDNAMGAGAEYLAKNENLAKAYRASSKKMPYFFWLPIKQREDRWELKCFFNGEDKFSEDKFSGDMVKSFSQDEVAQRLGEVLRG